MASYTFGRPIPGQSLTTTPRNATYERPPEVVDPEEALYIHLNNLTNPDAIEDLMFFIELGVDIKTLTEGILRSAVMEGIHTIDVSLIIAPTIHEFIKSTADVLKVEYDEGFDDTDRDEVSYQRRAVLARKELRKFKEELDNAIDEVDMGEVESRVEGIRSAEPMEDEMMPEEEPEQMEMDLQMPERGGAGLMSRGM